jgi:hypothetical protein
MVIKTLDIGRVLAPALESLTGISYLTHILHCKMLIQLRSSAVTTRCMHGTCSHHMTGRTDAEISARSWALANASMREWEYVYIPPAALDKANILSASGHACGLDAFPGTRRLVIWL